MNQDIQIETVNRSNTALRHSTDNMRGKDALCCFFYIFYALNNTYRQYKAKTIK